MSLKKKIFIGLGIVVFVQIILGVFFIDGEMQNLAEMEQISLLPDEYMITEEAYEDLFENHVPESVISQLKNLEGQKFSQKENFLTAVKNTIGSESTNEYKTEILEYGLAPNKWRGFLKLNTLTIIWTLIIDGLLIWIALKVRKTMKEVPDKLQNVVELYIESFDNLTIETLEEKKLARKYFPLISTLFIFILLSNWLGIIPSFWQLIQWKNAPHFFQIFVVEEPTRDLNTTLGLGIISFFVVHFSAIKIKGLGEYIKEYFEPIFVMAPLNVIGELAKVVSHSFRLFGNIMGGAVIIIVVSSLVRFIALPILLNGFFGIFVGAVQAFVFAMLALTYIAVAIK
jgi:F-type H+-transporting ATPase subunit a